MEAFRWWAWRLLLPFLALIGGLTSVYFGLTAKDAGGAISGVLLGLIFAIYPIFAVVHELKVGYFGLTHNRG
jgi:hypothetical protein